MAAQKIILILEWENNKFFELTEKPEGGEKKTIMRAEENQHLEAMWPNIAAACSGFFGAVMAKIGEEMTSS